MKGNRKWVSVLMVVGALLAALLPSATALAAGKPNPGILPPDSHPYGATYGEWSARWWQWVVSIPASTSPLTDTDGSFCNIGQTGHVWFLAGSWGYGDWDRSCTIPTGTAIFVPLANAFCAAVPLPPETPTAEAAQACAAAYVNHEDQISAELDGKALQGLEAYRFQSPIWDMTLGADNGLGAPPGFYPYWAADGTYVMFTPLPPGEHTLVFRWHIATFYDEWNAYQVPEGTSEVIYHLTVR
jgi:hypothetical protein